ncbi:MAG TPA: hypothetical protein PLO64_06455 [Methanothermobacter sp.]|nr:conserved hypothetical protein [Methanothermobacter sp. MT-2]HHW04904.1 hypothetical protein [Methanothermobacter sp.]HOK73263.1 hypothetical protein [Methanothermobacter sp.]HOL69556.1 hypothetical protein [Methanothermobacter sp.]HPQ05127.1 hypothetical protein [Methanothermobacter sp.]
MLSREEAKELQDKLIIIYKFISHQKHLKGLFGYRPPMVSNLVEKLLKTSGSEKILKEAIMELETIIKPDTQKSEELFYHIINREDVEFIAKRYGMKDSWDLKRLKIEKILRKI